MTRNVTSIGRRRFLQTGALGLGAGALGPGPAAGQGGGVRSGSTAEPSTGRVRMSGDGLGLTPADQGRLLARLAGEGRIARDSYSNGGVVGELEERFAALLGKERAVFMPTGTLANHLAVRALAGGRGRAVVQAESHLFNDSGDCVQTLSGITLMPLAPGRATFTLDDVQEVIDRTAGGRVSRPVSVISVETPVRRRFGERFDQAELDRVTAFARARGIGLHLDGARLFLQSACTGVGVAEYARPFDTVYVSLYKYFNAVSGAILAGPRALLDDMYHTRRCSGRGCPVPGRSRRWRSTICRASSTAFAGPSGCPRHSSIASPGTRRSGWNGCRPPRTSSGFGCPPPTPPASARGCATAVSIWGGRAPTAPYSSASTRRGTARPPRRWRSASPRPFS